MSERATQLVQEVLALPPDEREEVVNQLWDRMEEEPPTLPFIDDEAEHAELLSRLEMVENGTADSIPRDEAMIEMRAELARRRAERMKP